MDKNNVIQLINEQKIIAIIRGLNEEYLLDTVQALLAGGINILEITFDHAKEDYIESTAKKIKTIRKYFGEGVIVGAGTVLTPEEVDKAVEAGAELIISPNTDERVIKQTVKLGKVSIPGALSPSEALQAYEAGATYVKLFPAGELGTSYIKALIAPLEHIPFLAVGGITVNNVAEFISLGVKGAGVGSSLVDKKVIKAKEYQKITQAAQSFNRSINKG